MVDLVVDLVDRWWRHLADVVTVAVINPHVHCWWIVVVGFPETKENIISGITKRFSSEWKYITTLLYFLCTC